MAEIQEKILKIINDPLAQKVLSVATTGIEIAYPQIGPFIELVKGVSSLSDEYRLHKLLKGLASGWNQETFTNEFKEYVKSSEDNAVYVANLLRKALLADSPIACTLMGRILSDHVGNKTSFDKFDSIIIFALGSAIDNDLLNFRKMMQEYYSKSSIQFIDVIDQETVDWCTMNRIFEQVNSSVEDEGIILEPRYKPKESAMRLMKYLDEIKQLLGESL